MMMARAMAPATIEERWVIGLGNVDPRPRK
jgi:hypothetical protein